LGGVAVSGLPIADMGPLMDAGTLRAVDLVDRYLKRIDSFDVHGPALYSVIELDPEARARAEALDEERLDQGRRGPLHGVPILVKDNIDTEVLQTSAGSLSLVGAPATQDATAVARLRAAGAIILGKGNLSEWANFRGFDSSSGWSARGGQGRNPYVIDRSPCGSSSGSAAAASASFCAAALGTETDGSIVCSASACGVVGLKPTVGLVSRAGVIPTALSLDSVGPLGRTVADAATVLGALVGVDPRDPATAASAGRFHTDYTQFLDPNGLAGARIGVAGQYTGFSAEADRIFDRALRKMEDAGAHVEEVGIPNFDELLSDPAEIIVLIHEFKRDLNAYLATRTGVPVSSLADVIAFNLDHAEEELSYFGQEWFELSQAEIFSEAEYLAALARGRMLAGAEGLDQCLASAGLDALVAPTGSPPWPIDLVNGDAFLGSSSTHSAMAGYPAISVPAGRIFRLPVGITFMAGAWSEPTLIRLASGFEAVTAPRRPPFYVATLPFPGPLSVAPLEAPARGRALPAASLLWRRGRPRINGI
jgi:amidase